MSMPLFLLLVVVINWGCSSPSDVPSELPNSSIISSSESSLVVSLSSLHIGLDVTQRLHLSSVGSAHVTGNTLNFVQLFFFQILADDDCSGIYLIQKQLVYLILHFLLVPPNYICCSLFHFFSCTFNFL